MTPKNLRMLLAIATIVLNAGTAVAAEDDGDPIYGEELMTTQEQDRYRDRLRELQTENARSAFLEQHRKELDARARARGQEPPIYGQRLMTQEERDQYRARMRSQATDAERAKLRAAHRTEMQARARAQRDRAAPPAQGADPTRGRDLMTDEERARQREKMRSEKTTEERERARDESHEKMKERAKERGVEIPPARRSGSGTSRSGGAGGGGGRGR